MLRYYPASKILTNQKTSGAEFLNSNGRVYSGKYYLTFDGKAFSGPSPEVGPSEPLQKINEYPSSPILGSLNITEQQKKELAIKTNVSPNRTLGKPVSYYPQPIESDYKRGYIIRYFTKKNNDTFVIEISEEEYNNIVDGTANYDIRIYQTQKILWKITGPLNSQRQSQYNVIPGIIDTNKRLVETANKTFLGILDYIGGDYAKFARPTA
jgi:hypothetical protein